MDLFISPTPPPPPPPWPDIAYHLRDPWVVVSALQKAVRRGNSQAALGAARFLLESNPDRLWRRLPTIALEDVGIGDLELVREVLLASTRKSWRADNGGDGHVAYILVTRLCRAPKCRDPCELLVTADLHPRFKEQRTAFVDLSQHQLSDILADPARHLTERTLSAWILAGTTRFAAYSMPEVEGSFPALLDVYRHIGVPEHVLEVARLGSTRTQEGHPLTIPLVWLAANRGPIKVAPADLPEPVLIRGWPSESYDMHNRIGRHALAQFTTRCTALQRLIERHVPLKAQADFVGHIVFRGEGHRVDRRLAYPGAGAILHDAEVAHLTFTGVPEGLALEALAVFGDHLDLLQQCRLEAVGGKA